jgi:hypothetical protein
MNKDPACARECQYAKDEACPEYSCVPACQYLLHRMPEPLPIPIPMGVDFDLKIDPKGDLEFFPAAKVISDFWKWDPKFDTEEYRQKMIKNMGLSPTFFEPEYGSSLYGPLVTDKVVKGIADAARNLKDETERFKIGEVSSWKCVDTGFDKKRKLLTQVWNRLDHVGSRSIVKKVWPQTPARLFKRLIRKNRQHLGSEIMDMWVSVQPVIPVNFISLTMIAHKDGGVTFDPVPMTEHKIEPVYEQTGDGPRISYINLGPNDASA